MEIQGQGRGVVLHAAGIGAFEVLCQLLLLSPLLGLFFLLSFGLVVLEVWIEALLREALIPLENLNFYLYSVVLPETVLQSLVLQLQKLTPLRELLYFSQKMDFLNLVEGGPAFRVGRVVLPEVCGGGRVVGVDGEKVSQLLHLLFNLIISHRK